MSGGFDDPGVDGTRKSVEGDGVDAVKSMDSRVELPSGVVVVCRRNDTFVLCSERQIVGERQPRPR